MNNIDSGTQMGTGEGAWTTGLSVSDVYNASTFVNKSNTVEETNGYLFAGAVPSNYNVSAMASIWVNGSCWVLPTPPFVDDSSLAFWDWCKTNGRDQYFSHTTLHQGSRVTLVITWCSDYFTNATYNHDWMNVAPYSPASVIVYINSTVYNNAPVDGFIQCNSTFATGTANIRGFDLTFTNFKQQPYFNTSTQREDIPYHPLYAALFSITQTFGNNDNSTSDESSGVFHERADSILRMLGYEAQYDMESGDGEISFLQANLSTIADHLWTGTSHMGAAIGLLSRDVLMLNATQNVPRSFAARDRDSRFIAITAVMLGIWFTVLLYCTLRMYRPTFGGSLNAYVAARLLADWPHLVNSQPCGELEENVALRAKFGHVGDTQPDKLIGHIGVAMGGIKGKLDARRSY
jgi:hypothetical protein